jgi:hypothetical protein
MDKLFNVIFLDEPGETDEVQKSHISRIESNASNGYTYLEQGHFSQLMNIRM